MKAYNFFYSDVFLYPLLKYIIGGTYELLHDRRDTIKSHLDPPLLDAYPY